MNGYPCHKDHIAPLHVPISRRAFLSAMGAAAASLLATGCGTILPTAPSATATPKESKAASSVAIAQATSYDRETVRTQVRNLLDALGGLANIVHSGDRVAIKINMTGGVSSAPLPGVTAIESYITHPEVVRALGEAVRDAGARELFLVEAAYEPASWTQWGFEEVAKAIDAKLIDLNSTQPYSDFAQVPVGNDAYIYKNFTFNHILQDIDVFISVPKMKCHYSAGVTLSMKNLVGLVPVSFYRLKQSDTYRSGFHGAVSETGTRLPRIIVDLNRARPIHFALIDGIKTTEGGEGPWIRGMAAVQPGVLIAGADPLATDTVAAAVMGFDPTAAPMSAPFVRSDNHLKLASDIGLGTNRLDAITTIGPAIKDVAYKFKPSW